MTHVHLTPAASCSMPNTCCNTHPRDLGGDFDRARRQQEVLDAVREEVLSVGGVTNFLGQAPALWDEPSGSFVTNLTLEEIISQRLMQDIPHDNIRFGVIDNLYVELATTTTGDQVLIPNHNAIRLLIAGVQPAGSPTVRSAHPRRAENATIVVFNNTDTVDWRTTPATGSPPASPSPVGNTAPNNADTVIQFIQIATDGALSGRATRPDRRPHPPRQTG
jgi:hypothetical protein